MLTVLRRYAFPIRGITRTISHSKSFCSSSTTKLLHKNCVDKNKPFSSVQLIRFYSNDQKVDVQNEESLQKDEEQREFQAETRMLLDIVARSLYSNKEVFVRELISNASDALEKYRYQTLTNQGETSDRTLEIHIETDKLNRVLTIKDNGIGMTKDELVNNLGTIARSGSKAFIEELKKSNEPGDAANNIIGKFGVGFYSAFMVCDRVEVHTKSSRDSSNGYVWQSDGSGTYTIKASDVKLDDGTKIVMHLKSDCREYADEETVKKVIEKYSNFVGSPILLNSKRINTIEPLWLKQPSEVTESQHAEFYRFAANTFDKPRFTLHYSTDAPLSIKAILYVPETRPAMFELSRDTDAGVALYSRKVLIQNRCDILFPKYLRFLKGVVDCEDIPLNLSRELLQNSRLIGNLKRTLTARVIKFLHNKMKNVEEYNMFYADYNPFIKEGIVTEHDFQQREDIAKLLRFESAKTEAGQNICLEDYVKQMIEGQNDIYYIAAPSRTLAESSPYYESLKTKQVDVLFCYDPYDELVLMQLKTFKNKSLKSAESQMRHDSASENVTDFGKDSLMKTQVDELASWLLSTLEGKISQVRAVKHLNKHPCVVTVEEMAAARHFLRTTGSNLGEAEQYAVLRPQLDINPGNPIIKKLYKLKNSDVELANCLATQLFLNAMVSAGLIQNPQAVVQSMNELLEKSLAKIND